MKYSLKIFEEYLPDLYVLPGKSMRARLEGPEEKAKTKLRQLRKVLACTEERT